MRMRFKDYDTMINKLGFMKAPKEGTVAVYDSIADTELKLNIETREITEARGCEMFIGTLLLQGDIQII